MEEKKEEVISMGEEVCETADAGGVENANGRDHASYDD